MFTSAKSYDVNAPGNLSPLPPVSDIWWWSLQTCSNLFIWGPTLPSNDIWWWQLKFKHLRFPRGRCASYWNAFLLFSRSIHDQSGVIIATSNNQGHMHNQVVPSGTSRISQTGGGEQKPIIWQGFCEKLHENVRNWAERGRDACPYRSPPPESAKLYFTLRAGWAQGGGDYSISFIIHDVMRCK